ncbi:serine hydrolase [Bradyrhizobium tropiciagri]|uniref:serine hydrolase domain-containing protein n=1 Tax=Bradyrhizobium tropiciagri TaxID=312253 RepID=UPI001BA6B475|nr:serine hydrolase [Bradyrhizobium tropiciagri]MBR0870013.1 serine hydrolase [Bradyrhizobium tropiciagri]
MGSARPLMAAVGVSLVIAAGFSARPATAQQATASTAETLAGLSATIAAQYPSARSLVLARGNCILHEYYALNSRDGLWPVHSVTKSVLSILVGIAIDKGLLRLDQKLPELVTEATEGSIDPRAADITLRDLLTMSSGFAPQEMAEVPGVWNSSVWMIRRTVEHPPGTHFHYDNEGTNLIAVILRRAVSGNIAEFARNELFAPLQIDRYYWPVDRDGNLPGYSGLLFTARDMAKIGLLYLQHGRWRERQVVSEAYVLDSTRKHIDGGEPANAGYGYLWWTKPIREGWQTHFAAGFQSQLILNIPDRNLVVALQSAASLPGGAAKFINEVVLSADAALPAEAACVGRLDQ